MRIPRRPQLVDAILDPVDGPDEVLGNHHGRNFLPELGEHFLQIALRPVVALLLLELLRHVLVLKDHAQVVFLEQSHGLAEGRPVHVHIVALEDVIHDDNGSLDGESVVIGKEVPQVLGPVADRSPDIQDD